jgi:hypothetical protein
MFDSKVGLWKAYLTCEDDDVVDSSSGFMLQELVNNEATCISGADNSKILVTRHDFGCGI